MTGFGFLGAIAVRTAVVAAVLLVGLRVTGKRQAGEGTLRDLLLALVMANAVQIQALQEASAKARVLVRDQYPEDIVGAVAFFAGEGASFITGQSLVVDGGAYFN